MLVKRGGVACEAPTALIWGGMNVATKLLIVFRQLHKWFPVLKHFALMQMFPDSGKTETDPWQFEAVVN